MARLALNKSALSREREQLRNFERFLPSLDLKRRQLIAEREQARAQLARTGQALQTLQRETAETLPMLASGQLELDGLVRVDAVDLGRENRLGTLLPTLRQVRVKTRAYSLLARPHWVDRLAERLAERLELQIRLQVEARRVELLERAVQLITQRVNLFDKVLIPRARNNIRRLQVHLADAERAAVIRAKLAKKSRASADRTGALQ
ncbi:V-type ATP synthase subunit D [Marinobacterium aestuariivivens]|uniref:V-type ATP synthase subunit D n=1 Tax=Marinobacterium aestuariivivens TaxID=1698799 RepID=A0ABW1ZUC9_9GAMM